MWLSSSSTFAKQNYSVQIDLDIMEWINYDADAKNCRRAPGSAFFFCIEGNFKRHMQLNLQLVIVDLDEEEEINWMVSPLAASRSLETI